MSWVRLQYPVMAARGRQTSTTLLVKLMIIVLMNLLTYKTILCVCPAVCLGFILFYLLYYEVGKCPGNKTTLKSKSIHNFGNPNWESDFMSNSEKIKVENWLNVVMILFLGMFIHNSKSQLCGIKSESIRKCEKVAAASGSLKASVQSWRSL